MKKKQVVVSGKTIRIESVLFTSLKKIGISVPFFKDECRMIFESQFGDFYAHVHITIQSEDFLDLFNKLICWRKNSFPSTS